MKRKIAWISIIVLLVALWPLSGYATSANSMTRTVTVGMDYDLTELSLMPQLIINDSNNSFSNETEVFQVQLEGQGEWKATIANNITVTGGASSLVEVNKLSATLLEIEAVLDAGAVVMIPMEVELTDADGDQIVRVIPLESPLTGDEHVYATAVEATTTANASVGDLFGGGYQQTGSIIVTETVKGALDGTHTMRLRLPVGFEWNPVHESGANIALNGFAHDENDPVADLEVELSNGRRDMTIRFVAVEGPTQRGSISILPSIAAANGSAYGPVSVTLNGDHGIANASSLVIADYKEDAVTVSSDTEDDTFVAGYGGNYTATINVREAIEDTLRKNQIIKVTLPDWVRVENGTQVKVDINNVATAGTNTREFQFILFPNVNWMDGDLFDFDITFDFLISGVAPIGDELDIPVQIEGAGLDKEVVIGMAVKSIAVDTVEVPATYLQAGLQQQEAPEITITELFPGALREGNLVFTSVGSFENNVRFEDITVEVVEGDIVLGTSDTDRDTFFFNITADSTVPSTIRISGVTVTMDRTVPDGSFRMDVSGTSVIDAINPAHDTFPDRIHRIDPFFFVGDEPALMAVSFTIGNDSYQVNGITYNMDVTTFVSNDRLMIPVRYLKELFGADPVWNEAERSVTIDYAGDSYKMTIGSATLLKNGEPTMEMDAVAQITDDRTFVPASRFALAMDIEFTYDEVTRTATFFR